MYRHWVSCNFEAQKIHSVATESLEEKDSVENEVTSGDSDQDTEIVTIAKMEDDSLDMPEDLSAKHRTVSVQTDTCLQDKFEEIFQDFSRKQIRSLMNVLLVQLVAKEDVGEIVDTTLESFSTKKSEQVSFFANLSSSRLLQLQLN